MPWLLSKQTLIQRFYYQLHLIQEIERKLSQSSVSEPLMHHRRHPRLTNGSEVCDVGVLNAIDVDRDVVFSTYHAHVHFLICSDDVAEYVARSMYLQGERGHNVTDDSEREQLPPVSGTDDLDLHVGKAMSVALTSKLDGAGAISVVLLNAQAVARRQLNHYCSVASLWSLPILFVSNVCMVPRGDAEASMNAPEVTLKTTDGKVLASQSIIANDVLKVYAFASAAASYVRANGRPFLLELTSPCYGTDRELTVPSSNGAKLADNEALWKVARKLGPVEQERIEGVVAKRIELAFQTVKRTTTPGLQV